MKSTNQMNGLYPIIRRVRRPLMPTDVLPDGHQADAKPTSAPPKDEEKMETETQQPDETLPETKHA
jgi:hypothetical protein